MMFRRILYTLILQLIFKCIRTLIIKQYLVVVYMLLSYHARRTQSDLQNCDRQKNGKERRVCSEIITCVIQEPV